MIKELGTLLGAAGAFVSVNGASVQAAPEQPELKVASYADLLQPIPDAVALLRASNDKLAATSAAPRAGNLEVAQYYYHHHHHHHGFIPRFYRHHHHHNNYYRRPRYYHHHHHHEYYRGY